MSLESSKAIVFSCHYNGLSIIQALGKAGIDCVAMDSKRTIGTYSKYAKFVKCPNPKYNEYKFVEFLFNYCYKENKKPILFPTNDQWAAAVSKHKGLLSEVSIPCVSDWETVKILIQKDIFYMIGKKNDYLTPLTFTKDELHEISEDKFPLVAKPKFRRNSSNKKDKLFYDNMERLRLVIIKSSNELKKFLEEEGDCLENLLFQEYINGYSDKMYTIGIYASQANHEILGLFTGKKIRGYPADFGDCIVGTNCKVPQYLIDNTKRVTKELKISGIVEFEYKKDSITDKFKLIEINPRSWSWIGITPECGVNLPLIAYNHLTKNKHAYYSCDLPDNSVKYINLLKDFGSCVFGYKKTYPEWHKGFWGWIKEIRKGEKKVYAEFNAGDVWVFIKAIIKIPLFALKLRE